MVSIRRVFIRRLDVETDLNLYREIYSWDENTVRWYRESDSLGRPEWDEFIAQAKRDDQIEIGVFDGELKAMISITRRAPQVYEGHLWAKRKTSLELITMAVYQVMDDLFARGMKEAFVVVAEKNRAVRRMCTALGMYPDEITIKGEYHGRPITWIKMSCRREQWAQVAA